MLQEFVIYKPTMPLGNRLINVIRENISFFWLIFLIFSKDILSRWTYPIVPDSNLQEGDSYEYMRGQIYKEQHVSLSRLILIFKLTMHSYSNYYLIF